MGNRKWLKEESKILQCLIKESIILGMSDEKSLAYYEFHKELLMAAIPNRTWFAILMEIDTNRVSAFGLSALNSRFVIGYTSRDLLV